MNRKMIGETIYIRVSDVLTQSWRSKSAVFRMYCPLTLNGYSNFINAIKRQRNLGLARCESKPLILSKVTFANDNSAQTVYIYFFKYCVMYPHVRHFDYVLLHIYIIFFWLQVKHTIKFWTSMVHLIYQSRFGFI